MEIGVLVAWMQFIDIVVYNVMLLFLCVKELCCILLPINTHEAAHFVVSVAEFNPTAEDN